MMENNLEILFKKAYKDQSLRDEFYKELLVTKLILLTPKDDSNDDDGTMSIINYGDVIPIFSSVYRVDDGDELREKYDIAAVDGRLLLEMLKDNTLVLNPHSSLHKKIVPEEIEYMLNLG